jgi:hypothetical protein
MPEIWSILLVVAGLLAIGAGVMLATGNKPWSSDSVEPTSPPADPGAEGMRVAGPGDITPGDPEQSAGESNRS